MMARFRVLRLVCLALALALMTALNVSQSPSAHAHPSYCDGYNPEYDMPNTPYTRLERPLYGGGGTLQVRFTDGVPGVPWCSWGRIFGAQEGAYVWMDRTHNRGATWEGPLYTKRLGRGYTQGYTLTVSLGTRDVPNTMVRTCGSAGKDRPITCTAWVGR
jgi:hypothetical protein